VVKVVDFKPLTPHAVGSNPNRDLGAIELAYGTSVVLLRCLFVPKIMRKVT
jgi:hypothetical protein